MASALRLLSIATLMAFLFTCCQTKNKAESIDSKGLKDAYSTYFQVGASVTPQSFNDSSTAALITTQFSSMTAENVMKMGPIHPKEDSFAWDPADKIVAFAEANSLMLRGHTLCWHNQAPDWMFVDSLGKTVSKEVLIARLEAHIAAVAGRYKGKIYAWDVVNEVISDNPDEFYRNSMWYQICGEDFIIKAFEFARKYDPAAKLFYNDYNETDSVKCEKIYQMVKKFQEMGVPIDGIGLQGHWSVYEPTEQRLRATLDRLGSLGLELQITELDVSIYQKEGPREHRDSDIDTFTPELQKMQAEQYDMLFRVFREYNNQITSVTFWNISDKGSWLDNFPVKGRKDYPLLFDQNNQPKDAYWKVVSF